MSDSRKFLKLYQRLDKSNNFAFLYFQIDGSELPNATATAAGVAVGKGFVTARDDGANLVTITFAEALPLAPKPFFSVAATDTVIDAVTVSKTGMTYTTVENDATGSAKDDADVDILLIVPLGPEVY